MTIVKNQCLFCKNDILSKRNKNYCSKKCFFSLREQKANRHICPVCKTSFRVKSCIVKKQKFFKTCSKKCGLIKFSETFSGRNNPSCIYKNLNDCFLSEIDTEEKAYILGWIASDGSVTPGAIVIEIHPQDIDVLVKIKNIICSSLEIKTRFRKSTGQTMVYLILSSTQISKDVCKHLKIKPKAKCRKMRFPVLETDKLNYAFLRGYFDGDGFVRQIRNHPLECGISSICMPMKKRIQEIVNLPSYLNSKQITWSTNNALELLHRIYDNSSIYLNRKYNIYQEWIDFHQKNKHLSPKSV